MKKQIVVTEGRLMEEQKSRIRETAAETKDQVLFFESPKEAAQGGGLQTAQILYGGGLATFLKDAPRVEWVCSSWSGVDAFFEPGVLPEGVVLTNAAGAYGDHC